MTVYRERKLLEYYLGRAALKYDLTLGEAKVLLCVGEQPCWNSRRELADLSDLTRNGLAVALNRLTARGLIKIGDRKENAEPADRNRRNRRRLQELRITLQEEGCEVLRGLEVACQDYEETRLAEFTAQERQQYQEYTGRVRENIIRILQ